VTYKFKNTANRSLTALMGFPEEGYDAYLDDKTKTRFKSFQSWVDGQPVDVFARSQKGDSVEADMGYSVWWMKEVPFKAGQTRTVKNVYVSEPGGTSMPSMLFMYLVHTARNWKDKISHLRLEVDAGGFKPGVHYAFGLKPSKSSGDVHAWYWADLEPTLDHNLNASWEHPEFEYGETTDWLALLSGHVFVSR
jgi:hypothetical protein